MITNRTRLAATAITACLALTACGVSDADSAPADVRGRLAHLRTAPAGTAAGYDRGRFGPAWTDVDHNHCDTRDDILARDLTSVHRRGRCIITAGTLHDRYTGKTLSFRRGAASAQVQIDHIYPLHRMWVMGAATWPTARREKAANDPANLLAVDGATNASKGDSGPSEWAPRRTEWCDYATRYITVAAAYKLPVTVADKTALARMLATC